MVFSDIRDVIVIGGGPSGIKCTIDLHRSGTDVLLVTRSIEMFFDNREGDRSKDLAHNNAVASITERLPTELSEANVIRYVYPYWNVTVGNKTYLANSVVLATGRDESLSDGLLRELDDLEWDDEGRLLVDGDYQNTYRNLHVIGDLASGFQSTVSTAIGMGETLARQLVKVPA